MPRTPESANARKARRKARRDRVKPLLTQLQAALGDDAPPLTERRAPEIARLIWQTLSKVEGSAE